MTHGMKPNNKFFARLTNEWDSLKVNLPPGLISPGILFIEISRNICKGV
jgi:hypothetical protein